MKNILFASLLVSVASVLQAESVNVSSGVEIWPAAKPLSAETLVKQGNGILDLSQATIGCKRLDVEAGTVRIAAGMTHGAYARYVRFVVSKARPAPSASPYYGNTGWQISEFRLTLDGKPIPYPAGTVTLPDLGGVEGPMKALDGNPKTKCLQGLGRALTIDLGQCVRFDGYTFDTPNDAIGRDPNTWRVEVGMANDGAIHWIQVGAIKDFVCPEKRFTNVGRIFPVVLNDVVPSGLAIHLAPGTRLILKDATELLDCLSGTGTIELDSTSLTIAPSCTFQGAIFGKGKVEWN